MQGSTPRKTLSLKLSKSLEYTLLTASLPHISLTHDIETAAQLGLELLIELLDVTDIIHSNEIKLLAQKTNAHTKMSDSHFDYWQLALSETLIDDIELIMLTHSDELHEYGIETITINTILVLLVIAGLHHNNFENDRQPIQSYLQAF